MTVHEQQSVVHLPDLLFVRYCQETYGLNRGVYNVIDEWFYRQNLVSVEMRRQQVLEFLLFFISLINKERNGHKLKFGKGELTNLLTEYWDRQSVLI
ncbi:hypothetical protein ASG99_16595 [Bacillus sp. Soil768D1]|nr:hypothetical protein ASG99_16595 [Bacillus sp. Soil768D1]